jgi:hypothetical protein
MLLICIDKCIYLKKVDAKYICNFFNVHLCQKVPFVLACFQASAAPRPENTDSDKKYVFFGLDTQITIFCLFQ